MNLNFLLFDFFWRFLCLMLYEFSIWSVLDLFRNGLFISSFSQTMCKLWEIKFSNTAYTRAYTVKDKYNTNVLTTFFFHIDFTHFILDWQTHAYNTFEWMLYTHMCTIALVTIVHSLTSDVHLRVAPRIAIF